MLRGARRGGPGRVHDKLPGSRRRVVDNHLFNIIAMVGVGRRAPGIDGDPNGGTIGTGRIEPPGIVVRASGGASDPRHRYLCVADSQSNTTRSASGI